MKLIINYQLSIISDEMINGNQFEAEKEAILCKRIDCQRKIRKGERDRIRQIVEWMNEKNCLSVRRARVCVYVCGDIQVFADYTNAHPCAARIAAACT